MINKIKNTVMALAMTFAFVAPVALPSISAYAVTCSNIADKITTGANTAATATGSCSDASGVGDDSIAKFAQGIVNTFSIVVGVAAVIMIIVGGFRYITSGGDSGRVGSAKNSLIYAIVGLVVVALAQVIVHFVLHQTGAITSTS
jgi:hypothetical protein